MKAILVSFFNSKNLGDILIGEKLYDIISKKIDIQKISYSEPLIVFEKRESKKSAPKIISDVKTLVYKILSKPILNRVLYYYNNNIKKYNLDFYEMEMLKSDILVIGGGNMIYDLDAYSSSSSKFNQFVQFAKENNKKVFAISLGIGPFATTRQEINAVRAIGNCDYVTFRDKASYDIFKKHNNEHQNISISIDPVFLNNFTNQNDKGTRIGLNIINGRLINQDDFEYSNTVNGYVELLNQLIMNTKEKIVLFSTEIADYETVNEVYREFESNERVEIQFITSTNELSLLYQDLKVLIGTRMHAMIIALTYGIPIIGISWQQKVDSLFEICNDSESVFDYGSLGIEVLNILKSLKLKLQSIEEEKIKIDDILKNARQSNEINEFYLNEILEKINK